MTFSFPVRGVASDSTSWLPVATIAPREAVQPISAFCNTCDTGLSALPAKLRGVLRSAMSPMALNAIAIGAMITELREAGGNGGSSVRTGPCVEPRDTKLIAVRPTTTDASNAIDRQPGSRLVASVV